MLAIVALVVFVLLLKAYGRIGPFVWDPSATPGRRGCGRVFGNPDPESVLAQRLADGDITPDDYLERLSMLQGQ